MPTNVEIVQACFAAFQRGDVATILNLCDDQVEWVEPGDPKSIPFAGRGKGKNSATEFFRVVGETTELLKWEPQQFVASGDRVVGFALWETRVKATGKVARSEIAVDFTVRNGKVARWQGYYDTGAVEAAFAATAKASA